MPTRADVTLRESRIGQLLGFELPAAEVERILSGLGLGVERSGEGWLCSVPSWRFDISSEADLLEELARGYGYNNLPVSHVRADLVLPARDERQLSVRHLRKHLAARDFREAITYSFVDPKLQQLFDPAMTPVALANPISADMAVMRTSLLPGLISAAQRNVNRQQPRVRLFETGLRFVPQEGGLQQLPTLAMLITGAKVEESWSASGGSVDFFDLKGELESVLALSRQAGDFAFVAAERDGLHPGQTAAITRKGQPVGYLGALHPAVGAQLDLAAGVFVCELDLSAVLSTQLPEFEELSKYPEVRRDISFVVDNSIAVAGLLEEVRSAAGGYLTNLTLFDVYTGKGIDPKRKSLSLGLTFRDQSRTLEDEDVNPAVGQVIDLLEKNYNAELRH